MFLYKLFTVAGFALAAWLLAKQVKLMWYEWLLGVLGWYLGSVALQNYGASIIETEPRAAGFLLAIFGVPALILLFLAYFLPMQRAKKA